MILVLKSHPSPWRLYRLALLAALLIVNRSAADEPAIDFAHDVVPIFRVHCGKCHTGDARRGGFSMNTRALLLAGGDSGTPGFVERNAAKSELIARVTSRDSDLRMPPEGAPLPDELVATLRRWVDAGAPWTEGFAFKGIGYEAPLALRKVELPPVRDGHTNPVDRIVDAYWEKQGIPRPPRCDDRTFIRRVSLDLVGLLPDAERVERFVADSDPTKREKLVRELLSDNITYAEHWLTFWNDLLRNDYNGTGFITGGRRQITGWLHRSLVANKPYDQFVRELIAPTDESRGFIDGIVWRGEVNASQTVPIQFAQNVGQSLLGINLKCASCHDSFIDRWTLKQTYDLAAVFSSKPLELHRCDKATGVTATPAWMFEELGQINAALPPSERLAQLGSLITSPGNGWLSRTLANRLWHRLLGRGIGHPVDALLAPPWSEDLLDFLAGDLVEHRWNIKQLLELMCTSEVYGAITPPVAGQPQGASYVFHGPLPRRMTAEQFTDAVWKLTGTAPTRLEADVVRFEIPLDAKPPEPASRWVWSNASADSSANEKLTFRKTFKLPFAPVYAAVVMAADNEAALFAGGKPCATSRDWQQPAIETITNKLKAGPNEIVVKAANGPAGGPAGLRVEIRARLADGSDAVITTDSTWEWTTVAADGKGQFAKGKEPTDWAAAAVIEHQEQWSAGQAPFAQKLLGAVVPGPLPMVRAALVKGTSLMAALGRPNRDQVVTSRPSDLTTLEAIQMANHQSLADEIAKGGKQILDRHGPAAESLLEWMFDAALSRSPTPAEAATVREMLGQRPSAEEVADCLWAIMMLPEFQLIR